MNLTNILFIAILNLLICIMTKNYYNAILDKCFKTEFVFFADVYYKQNR